MVDIAPPAPPPYQPAAPSNNPYEFITNPGTPQKKGLFSGGSKKQRVLVVGFLAFVLLMVGMIVVALLSGSGGGTKEDYLSVLQQQSEIIRVSELGEKSARNAPAKNLAITAKLSITTAQTSIIPLAKKAGAPTDNKSIALGKDADIDTKLTVAEQTNQFDEVFIKTMEELLAKYQTTLKKLYDQSSNADTKRTLQQAYNNASLLISEKETP